MSPNSGMTRSMLLPTARCAVAHHVKAWFFIMSIICLMPVCALSLFLTLGDLSVFGSHLLRREHDSVKSIAIGISGLYMYSVMPVLAYASRQFLALDRLVPQTLRFRRTHSCFLRARDLRRFVRDKYFTVFVQGASVRTVPILVSNSMTVKTVFDTLRQRRLIPSTHAVTHRLYSSRRRLYSNDIIGDLPIGAMSHLQLRLLIPGGSGSGDEYTGGSDSENSDNDLPKTPTPKRRKSASLNLVSPNQSPESPSKNHRPKATRTDAGPSNRPSTPDSPSKRTRSKTSSAQKKGRQSSPIILVSPSKARKKTVKSSDLDVWDLSDEEIIRQARVGWKSKVYDHYNVILQRHTTAEGKPHHLTFKFKCRHDPLTHKDQLRDRLRTGQGTSNLQRSAESCDKSRGVRPEDDSSAGAQQTLTKSISTYSAARHRAVIALRCASSYRPFNSVKDPYYLLEVELLRPGTKIPSPQTVSRHVQLIYAEGSKLVKEYFERLDSAIHLVMDGWTAPFVASYLGIVVIWFSNGKIWRAVLEFIRLTERHTGEYLAEVTADCLKRFGLDKKIHTLCMDNASNCDKAAAELGKLIPHFRGTASRTRCFPHTVNLIAKAFISFFFRQPVKPKKAPKVAAGAKRKKARTRAAADPVVHDPSPTEGASTDAVEEEVDPIAREVAEHDREETEQSGAVDEAKEAHDDSVVRSIKALAIKTAGEQFGIFMLPSEEALALGVFPKVAGLARRLHDSPTLQEKFEKLIDASGEFEGQKRALDRRVPTRWNSDYTCLETHVHFESPVRQLTSANDLRAYALTDEQWLLAKNMIAVLEIFMEITELFSQAEVPLVFQVIPIIEQMEHQLQDVRDAKNELPEVIRIAAQASLLVIEKYYALTDENEVYRIAIVMCPHRKLDWFNQNPDWRAEDRTNVDRIVRARWRETYAPKDVGRTDSVRPAEPAKVRSKWSSAHRATDMLSSADPEDSIEGYLKSPPLTADMIKEAGGVLKYWEQARSTRPNLARMALDFLTAPASSVDAERSFSSGRLTVNHLQHNVSSQSFKSQVAVGSWTRTPLLSDLGVVSKIISKGMEKGKGKGSSDVIDGENEGTANYKGKGKARDVIELED